QSLSITLVLLSKAVRNFQLCLYKPVFCRAMVSQEGNKTLEYFHLLLSSFFQVPPRALTCTGLSGYDHCASVDLVSTSYRESGIQLPVGGILLLGIHWHVTWCI